MKSGAGFEERIRRFVVEGIGSGTMVPGQKLPTERELASMFACPRSQVRKTLMWMELEGRIVRHVGRGTFVARNGQQPQELKGIAPDVSPADLIGARLVLEPHLAGLVVANATSGDFAAMSAALAGAERAHSLEVYEVCDEEFHLAIARATHNDLLLRTTEMLTAARRSADWGRLKQQRDTFGSVRRQQARGEHLAILEALKNRDAEAAARALTAHIKGVRTNLLGG